MSVGKDSILRAANADAKKTEVKAETKPAEEVKAPVKAEAGIHQAVQSISGGGFHFLFQRAQTVLHINNVLFGGNQFFVNGMMAMNVLILGKVADIFIFGKYHVS